MAYYNGKALHWAKNYLRRLVIRRSVSRAAPRASWDGEQRGTIGQPASQPAAHAIVLLGSAFVPPRAPSVTPGAKVSALPLMAFI